MAFFIQVVAVAGWIRRRYTFPQQTTWELPVGKTKKNVNNYFSNTWFLVFFKDIVCRGIYSSIVAKISFYFVLVTFFTNLSYFGNFFLLKEIRFVNIFICISTYYLHLHIQPIQKCCFSGSDFDKFLQI